MDSVKKNCFQRLARATRSPKRCRSFACSTHSSVSCTPHTFHSFTHSLAAFSLTPLRQSYGLPCSVRSPARSLIRSFVTRVRKCFATSSLVPLAHSLLSTISTEADKYFFRTSNYKFNLELIFYCSYQTNSSIDNF